MSLLVLSIDTAIQRLLNALRIHLRLLMRTLVITLVIHRRSRKDRVFALLRRQRGRLDIHVADEVHAVVFEQHDRRLEAFVGGRLVEDPVRLAETLGVPGGQRGAGAEQVLVFAAHNAVEVVVGGGVEVLVFDVCERDLKDGFEGFEAVGCGPGFVFGAGVGDDVGDDDLDAVCLVLRKMMRSV
jgi:hypothetical protein